MNLSLPLFAALALVNTAQAQTASVRFADLDLSRPAGKAELERRIEAATRQVCKTELQPGSRFADQIELRRCEAGVRQQISEQMPR